MLTVEETLSGIVVILFIPLVIILGVWYFKRYWKDLTGEGKAEKLSKITLAAIRGKRGTLFSCSKCGLSFPSYSWNKYKILEEGDKKTIRSVCCDAVCKYQVKDLK